MTLVKPVLISVVCTSSFLFGSSAKAQYYGADPAQIAASTYCAARSQGLDNVQASRRANEAMAAAGDFATIIVHMNDINSRKEYLAKQQCPQYFGLAPIAPAQSGSGQETQRVVPTKAEISKDACALYASGQVDLVKTVEEIGLKAGTTKIQIQKYCSFYK